MGRRLPEYLPSPASLFPGDHNGDGWCEAAECVAGRGICVGLAEPAGTGLPAAAVSVSVHAC